MFKATLFTFMLIFCHAASAMSVEEYRKAKSHSMSDLKSYIEGVGKGIEWSNSTLQARGQKPLCCPPDTLLLDEEKFIRIIDRQIAKMRNPAGSTPVELILLMGLADRYPCPR